MTVSPLNTDVADKLREAAALLEVQGANSFRIHAYRRAADTVEALDGDLRACSWAPDKPMQPHARVPSWPRA